MNILMPGVFARGLCDLGVAELAGSAKNPRIMAYYAYAGLTPPNDEAFEWCGFALGAWVKEEGGPPPSEWWYPDSWASWGTALFLSGPPEPGAILVKKGTNTHVAIIAGISPPGARPWISGWGVCTLGGNQGGRVTIGDWAPLSDYKAMRAPPAW